jgi:hypothetical protein
MERDDSDLFGRRRKRTSLLNLQEKKFIEQNYDREMKAVRI